MRNKSAFGIFILAAMVLSSKSSAKEAYVGYHDNFYLVDVYAAETTDKTIVVFKDGPNVGAQGTVGTQYIYSKEGSEGKLKAGDAAYVNVKELTARVEIIGFSPTHFVLVHATEGNVSRRAAVDINEILPVTGSFGGIAIGQQIAVVAPKDKDSKLEILNIKVVSYKGDILIAESPTQIFIVSLNDILKFDGCSKSRFLCVGQNYYSSNLKKTLKLKAFTEGGYAYLTSEGAKLQTAENIETDKTLAVTQTGVCANDLCVGETYLNALNNYGEVKVEAISQDYKLYISDKNNPSEIFEFGGNSFDLMKASEKQTSLNGINIGQKIVLLNSKKAHPLSFGKLLLGISRNHFPIVDHNGKPSEFFDDIILAEGCDEKSKKCVGQRFSYIDDGHNISVKIYGIQSNGKFLIGDLKSHGAYFWDVDANSLRRTGCPNGICEEKDFKY